MKQNWRAYNFVQKVIQGIPLYSIYRALEGAKHEKKSHFHQKHHFRGTIFNHYVKQNCKAQNFLQKSHSLHTLSPICVALGGANHEKTYD